MEQEGAAYWERVWQEEDPEQLALFLAGYQGAGEQLAALFREHGVTTVCDAACGFGAYSLLFSSHGFQVEGFDLSPTAVALTQTLLARYGLDPSRYRTADLLDTGYPDGCFDAAVAHAVLDHLPQADAPRAVAELLRIVKPGGLILLSFDPLEEEDRLQPHTLLADGSFLYTHGARAGLLFRWYSDREIEALLWGRCVIRLQTLPNGERLAVVQKPVETEMDTLFYSIP